MTIPWILLIGTGVANGADGDAFSLGVGQSVGYESNLYRLADDEAAPGGTRHDTVSVTTMNGAFDRTYSRQRLRAKVAIADTRFAEHDELDHTAPSLRLGWDWQVGSRWSGIVDHEYRERLVDFDETSGAARNINVFRRTGTSANYWWHPDWATGAGVSSIESRFKDNALPESEYNARTTALSLTYRPKSGNRLVLSVRNTDGRFPNRPPVQGSIRDYQQDDLLLNGNWQATGALSVSGYVGQTHRSYDLAPERDFSGMTGRLTFNWVATGKTSVRLSMRREIGAESDLVSSYAVTKAISLAPTWAVTDKIRLGANYEVRQRDYGGNPAPGSATPTADDREDRTNIFGLSLSYQPMRALTLGLRLQRQTRDSKDPAREYDADSALLTGEFTF